MLGWAVETTLVAAGLAALATLAARSGRVSPEARHALWLVVLLRFLMPPLIAWPWARGAPPVVAEVAVAVAPLVASPADRAAAAPLVAAPVVPDLVGPVPIPPVVVAPAVVPAPSPPPSPPGPAPSPRARAAPVVAPHLAPVRLAWRPALLATWLVGAVVTAARGAIRVLRFGRMLRLADPAPGWLVLEVAAVAARLGVRRPPVAVVVLGLHGPLLWCLGRPRLVLPMDLDRLTPAARAGLLAHELAHLARRDHWVARLDLLAGPLWWWNPVFHLARRRLRDAAEAACDARAVRAAPEHRFAYAEALVHVCAAHVGPAPPLPALGIGGPRAARTLEARLTMILRDPARPPTRRLAPFALALLALAAPAWTRGQQPAEPPPAVPPTVPADPSPVSPVAVPPPLATEPDADQLVRLRAEVERLKAQLDAAPEPARAQPLILKARRAAQAAEVAGAEARRARLQRSSARADTMLERGAIGREEYDQIKADFKVAEAEVDRERAKLAEADALLGRAAPVSDPVAARPAGREPLGVAILQARRDAQAAEVKRFQVQLLIAQDAIERNKSLNRKIANSVSREEEQAARNRYQLAQAEVDREQARLVEADALLAQGGSPSPRAAQPGRDEVAINQARRDAQAAEVAKAEAAYNLAQHELQQTSRLANAKNPAVSQREVVLFLDRARIAEAEVAAQRARLAEADAVIDQARPVGTPSVEREAAPGERPVTLADLRDAAELAAIQAEVKRAELARVRARADQAGALRQARQKLHDSMAISNQVWQETKDADEDAQGEVAVKQVEVREAELRLKQAQRREGAEGTRLKRLAERARAQWELVRELAQNARGKNPGDVAAARGRYDELMFQLDPGYDPTANPPGAGEPPAAPPATPR